MYPDQLAGRVDVRPINITVSELNLVFHRLVLRALLA